MKEFRKIHQYNAFSSDTPKQVALSTFLKKKENYLELGNLLQQKRDYFQNGMLQTKLKPLATHGSYFQVYSYEGISNNPEKDFAIYLTREYGVATIPVASFYQENVNNQVLRFCFSKKESTLDAAIERLLKL